MKNESIVDSPATTAIPVAPATSIAMAARLLNQQIWCWGCDVKYGEGNLLVRHGFLRVEKPPGSPSASLYRLELSPTARVVLRGFGVFYGDDLLGGLFLRRFEFKPQLTPTADLPEAVWSVDDLPPLASPCRDQIPDAERLIANLIEWIQGYEAWISANIGIAYRKRTLTEWNPQHGTTIPAEGVIAAWHALSLSISADPNRYIPCRKTRRRKRGKSKGPIK